MAHAPTPWSLKKNFKGARIYSANEYMVADAKTCDGFPLIEDSNAAFIVRACNAHDALLEAARLAVADGECFCHAGPESAGRHKLGLGPGPCDYCVAKQAVALAEGRGE